MVTFTIKPKTLKTSLLTLNLRPKVLTNQRDTLFRQNLQDYAIKWWNLDVTDEQEEWSAIKDLFLSKFGFGTTADEKLFALQRDIINLKQGENEDLVVCGSSENDIKEG
jgi:hypothetical protein